MIDGSEEWFFGLVNALFEFGYVNEAIEAASLLLLIEAEFGIKFGSTSHVSLQVE